MNPKQQGNALWFILVAIGLLGLLTIMMSRTSSTSNETGSYEQNLILANEILNYAQSFENAFQSLIIRGCSENDISFWNEDTNGSGTENVGDTYFNVNAPSDKSCHIFDVAGTGMTLLPPNETALDPSQSAGFNYGSYIFNNKNQVKNLETDSRDDMLIILDWINLETCQAINHILFSDTTIIEDPVNFASSPDADGNFDTGSEVIDLSSSSAQNGRNAACFESQTNSGYHFYYALQPR